MNIQFILALGIVLIPFFNCYAQSTEDDSLKKGREYAIAKNYDEAMAEVNKVIRMNPRNSKAFNELGNIEYKKSLFDQAIMDYSKAIEINPNYDEAYYNRANVYIDKDNLDQAISDLNKAIDINPHNGDAYFLRGRIEGAKGQGDQAMADLKAFNKEVKNKVMALMFRFLPVSWSLSLVRTVQKTMK